jgi:hypothetical protein
VAHVTVADDTLKMMPHDVIRPGADWFEVPVRASDISAAEYRIQALMEGESHLSPSTDKSIGLSNAELKVEWRVFHSWSGDVQGTP